MHYANENVLSNSNGKKQDKKRKKIKEMFELKIKVHDKEKKCRLILA